MCAAHLVVVGIDFGTTFSGFAYSFREEFQKDPSQIYANIWNSGENISSKTPSVVLLNPDRSFNSFGYEAENIYNHLFEEDDEDGDDEAEGHENNKNKEDPTKYFYFRHFKMVLYNEKIKRNIMIKDETGKKEESAMVVFSHAIKSLAEKSFKELAKKVVEIQQSDLLYVLTVPAIWSDKAKQFMRESSEMAGLKSNQVLIALEPEVASLYCQTLKICKENDATENVLSTFKPETKFMTCDIGGGTTDITIHRYLENGNLEEITPPIGDACGGTDVDNEFLAFLNECFTEENMNIFKKKFILDYLTLIRKFEIGKRKGPTISSSNSTISQKIAIPFELEKMCNFRSHSTNPRFKKVKICKHKLHIPLDVFASFFENTCNTISDCIEKVLQNQVCSDVEHIVVVGGMADSEIVQNHLKSRFCNMKIIFPSEAGLAVLKGACMFGNCPTSISYRASPYTYGTQSWPEFDASIHPNEKKVILDGVERCKDVFFRLVSKGQILKPGHSESKVFEILVPSEGVFKCSIYCSTKENPLLIDECEQLGILRIPIDPQQTEPMELEETFIFGETELRFEVKNLKTLDLFSATFDTLQ